MKITVKTEKATKSFKSNYYMNAGSTKLQGMIITALATVVLIFGVFSSTSTNTNIFTFAPFLLIPIGIFIIFLLSYLADMRDHNTNVEIDINNSILRIGMHSWKILKGKWQVKNKTYSTGRSGIKAFEYFELIIPTSSSYFPDIKITTTAFIEFKEFVEKNSENKISIDEKSIFD